MTMGGLGPRRPLADRAGRRIGDAAPHPRSRAASRRTRNMTATCRVRFPHLTGEDLSDE
jgi:hypothetical protein